VSFESDSDHLPRPFCGSIGNAGKAEHLRFTAVWMKQNGRWQEVAPNANIIPQQSQ